MKNIKARLIRPPAQRSFFLFGPRGTGKSTWLSMAFPDALTIDLLSQDEYRYYLARPDRLRETIAGSPDAATIIIDEIQRVPDLLSVIHHLIEAYPDRQFIMTGSSSRKLKRTGADLLGGRALLQTCHPFMASELGDEFDFMDALRFGTVPLVLDAQDRETQIKAYVTLYLREEVQAEGLVRNIGSFARFLEAISFSHANLLNITAVARECEVSRKTVEGYVEILSDLLLSCSLPVFAKRAKRHLVKHAKFYFFDAGIYRGIRPRGPVDTPFEIDGAALEGLVLQHLQAWNAYDGGRHSLYFWRTKSGREVDFVVYGEACFVAIEVKNSERIDRSDLSSLRAFSEDYPECQRLALYRGSRRLMIDSILCMPCDEFLRGLTPGMPIHS